MRAAVQFFLLLCVVIGSPLSTSNAETLVVQADKSLSPGLKRIAREFERKHTEIKVKVTERPGGITREARFKAQLLSDAPPDVMAYLTGSILHAAKPADHLFDLSDRAFSQHINPSFAVSASQNGKLLAAPYGSMLVGGIFYNKKIYRSLGLEEPETWNEFLENCAKVAAAGVSPISFSLETTWTTQVLFLADFHNMLADDPNFPTRLTNGQIKYGSDSKARISFEKLSQLQNLGYVDRKAGNRILRESVTDLASGRAAHTIGLSVVVGLLNDLDPAAPDQIGFFPIPGKTANSGATLWMPLGLYVPRAGQNRKAALKFIDFVMDEANCDLLKQTDIAFGPFAIDTCTWDENQPLYEMEMARHFDDKGATPALEFLTPLKGPSLEVLTRQLLLGEITAQEAADRYDRDLLKRALELKLPGWP